MTSLRPQHNKTFQSHAIGLSIGLVAAALGLLPWFMAGARLPLQNLSSSAPQLQEALQETNIDMDVFSPFSMLPLSQYGVVETAAWVVMGGVLAGLGVWLIRYRLTVDALMASVGLLMGHLVVTVQAFTALRSVLPPLEMSLANNYFLALLSGVVASATAAQVFFWLLASRQLGARIAAVVLTSIPISLWILGIVGTLIGTNPLGSVAGSASVNPWIDAYLPALISGMAIGFAGFKPLSRIWLWLLAIAYLWLVPAMLMAAQLGLGSRNLISRPREMVLAIGQVFATNLGPTGHGPTLILTALVLAVVVLIARALVAKRTPHPQKAEKLPVDSRQVKRL